MRKIGKTQKSRSAGKLRVSVKRGGALPPTSATYTGQAYSGTPPPVAWSRAVEQARAKARAKAKPEAKAKAKPKAAAKPPAAWSRAAEQARAKAKPEAKAKAKPEAKPKPPAAWSRAAEQAKARPKPKLKPKAKAKPKPKRRKHGPIKPTPGLSPIALAYLALHEAERERKLLARRRAPRPTDLVPEKPPIPAPKPRKPRKKREPKRPEIAVYKEATGDTRGEQAATMADFFNELLVFACRQSPARCLVHKSVIERDYSVNAELVFSVSGSINDLIDELQLGAIWPQGDYWISVGVKYIATDEQRQRAKTRTESRYLAWLGMREIFDYGRRIEKAGYAWLWLAHEVMPRLEAQGFGIRTLHIRLHWNHEHKQPQYNTAKPWQDYIKDTGDEDMEPDEDEDEE